MRTRFPLFWNWVQFISFRSAIHLVDLTTVFQNTHDVIRDRVGYFCASKHCFYQIENIAFVISVNRHRQPKQRSEKYRKKTEKISKGNRNTHHEHRQKILDTNTKCFVDFPDGAGTILIWSVATTQHNKQKQERKKERKKPNRINNCLRANDTAHTSNEILPLSTLTRNTFNGDAVFKRLMESSPLHTRRAGAGPGRTAWMSKRRGTVNAKQMGTAPLINLLLLVILLRRSSGKFSFSVRARRQCLHDLCCVQFLFFFKCCLMSSDVRSHIRDKLRPMREHGSIVPDVHGNQKARLDGQPRTATSTLTQLLNDVSCVPNCTTHNKYWHYLNQE